MPIKSWMDPLLNSLRAAVAAAPNDARLRLHLAELLIGAGETEEALQNLGKALELDPMSARTLELIRRASGSPEPVDDDPLAALEREFDGVVPPMFVEGASHDEQAPDAWAATRETVTLADVGGLDDVKHRLEVAFLGPLRNEELRHLYRKDVRGGLLLYGPPGCGKGFVARALAGEIGASFLSVSINEVLEMWIGSSERNLHEIFATARRRSPTVLFFDELDALGRKRSQLSNSAMRTTVNQLLHELDGVGVENTDVFVLGATNHPWDIDPALRRPGRFDRTVLVLPPDQAAREAIFRTHLSDRPIAGIDPHRLATLTDGFTGADIAHVCDSAAERALSDAIRSGERRMIEMRDLEAAAREVRPSAGPWFEVAKNVVTFANTDGTYDELRDYMKKKGMA